MAEDPTTIQNLEAMARDNVAATQRELDSRRDGFYRVSVLVSSYRSAAYLDGLFDDLAAQTLYQRGELEIVLVDSHSPDDEDWRIVERRASSMRHVRAIRTRQRESLYLAWNRAVAESRGSYLSNANCDDRHRPDALELLAQALDEHRDADLVHGDGWVNRTEGASYQAADRDRPFTTPGFLAPALLLYYGFGFQPLWRRELHGRIGLFDGSYRAAGDWDFGIRLAHAGRALHLPLRLGAFFEGESNISYGDDTMARENERIRSRHLTPEAVEALYRREGIAADRPEERARLHLDFGLRALEFVNPMGDRRRRLDVAIAAFERAAELHSEAAAPWVNIAVGMALAGHGDEALKLLATVRSRFDHPAAPANEARIRAGLEPLARYGGLAPVTSGLHLPSQLELAAGRDRRREDMPGGADPNPTSKARTLTPGEVIPS